MNTIEERAKKYADSYMCDGDLARAVIMSYSQGATAQREIDIQRAVEIYEHELKEIVAVINRFSKDDVGEVISIEGSVKDFEEAMKGE